jgi:hypothetical protein
MKVLFVLLGLAGLMLVIGGLGSVAEQTYPAVVPVQTAVSTGAVEGNPALLLICVVAVVVGLVAGIKSGS